MYYIWAGMCGGQEESKTARVKRRIVADRRSGGDCEGDWYGGGSTCGESVEVALSRAAPFGDVSGLLHYFGRRYTAPHGDRSRTPSIAYMIASVNIIGTGRMAHFLAVHLHQRVRIKTVFSRKRSRAQQLTSLYGGRAVDELSALAEADLTIICVSDDAIEQVQQQLPPDRPTVHTSGAKHLQLLARFQSSGVLYPLQTLSKERASQLRDVPFLIEASSAHFQEQLEAFVLRHLSPVCRAMPSEKRAYFHLAAVFANNFTNHLLHLSNEVLKEQQLPFHLLAPLVRETAEKSFALSPQRAQTGPAVRGDEQTIARHLELLQRSEWKAVYHLLTQSIRDGS